MQHRTIVFAMLGLMVSSLVVADLGFAADERFRARLEPCCGNPVVPEPDAEGRAEHRSRSRTNRMEVRFRATVEIPIPSGGLGIENPADAESADIRLILSNDGAPYAECLLELEADELTDDQAEYKVDLRMRKRGGRERTRMQKGTCDINLATEGVQPGIPTVQDGDLATVTLVKNLADRLQDVDFMDGEFEAR